MLIPLVNNKEFRFEYNPLLAKSDINISATSEVFVGFNDNKWWVGVRWRVNGLDNTNEEILGYLCERRSFAYKDDKTKEQDKEDLRMFLYNSFINVEMKVNDTLGLPYNVFGKPNQRPNFESLANILYTQLTEQGFYN